LGALHDSLFELAGEDRLNMLLELKKKPMRLSHLSKGLGFTVQEAARNLSRLSEARLIVKDPDGTFRLTPYGEATMNLLAGLDFLSRHRDYFLTHTLSRLPREFSYGLASLSGCEMIDDVMVAFSNVENMIQKAEKHIWILSDQVLVSTIPRLEEALDRGVEFRLILPTGVAPPRDALERMTDASFSRAINKGLFEERLLKSVDVLICLSDKELAALGFSNTDGKMDYRGFRASDEMSVKWAKALFLHYWSSSTRATPEYVPLS